MKLVLLSLSQESTGLSVFVRRESKRDRMKMSIISRRALCTRGTTAAAFSVLVAKNQMIISAAVGMTENLPSMVSTPSWTLLMPLIDFRSYLEKLAKGENIEKIRGAIEKLERGIFSPKFFLLGVGSKYASLIEYDDLDKELIRLDREIRMQALVDANTAIDTAGKKAQNSNDLQASIAALNAAVSALTTFLNRCPPNDVERAIRTINALRSADKDRDGKISETEFYAAHDLTQTDRVAVTWGVYGTTLLQKQIPDSVFLDVLSFSKPPDVPPELRAAIVKSEF